MKATRSPFLISATLSIGLIGSITMSLAQEKPAAAPEYDIEARKQSVANLERHIAQRQERINEIAQDMITLDKRVEKRIDLIVDMLKKSKDSKGSKVAIARTKEKAIEGLHKAINYYDQKRRGLREELRTDTAIPRELLEEDVKKFDDRVEKRIEQIITLTKSFTEHEDLKKYDEHTRNELGWSWTERRISEDWRQNNRDARHTKLEKKRQLEALEKSIASMKSRNAWLKKHIEGDDASEEEKELFKKDLARNEEVIMTRQYQIDRLLTTGDQPETKELSRETAHEMVDAVADIAKDLRNDFFAIFGNYSKLNEEREQIAKLTKNLEARKKWLAENAPAE